MAYAQPSGTPARAVCGTSGLIRTTLPGPARTSGRGSADVLDPAGDGRDDVPVVRVAGEGVAHVAGAQQIEPGQFRVLPVPRPLPARPSSVPIPPFCAAGRAR